ncbi:hypothetical protein LSH36_120g16009 [Paralvinella palmiformis]|uniref:Calcium uniporter protein n=1 Tax=Paralvinella palmiformis TaxID=53620 RepID=A0AAD9JYE4_9ANNE|nr:hypothetical protein LSH36_120g16009 [Paralvinella palmiformis]
MNSEEWLFLSRSQTGWCIWGIVSAVHVTHRHGLPVLSVPLPSRKEQCQFTLKPFGDNLGDFFSHLQQEDHGIDRIAAYSTDGVRIAKSTPISSLLQNDFELVINDRRYLVPATPSVKLSHEHDLELSDVKNQIAQLFTALNIETHQLERERQLIEQLEQLQEELEPYEKLKIELEQRAHKRTTRLSWLGLGLMGLQFGILARLTWWEYSWDIMEPVTYFITYGTTIAMFAYYVVTKQEYNFVEVRDREFLLTMYRHGKRLNMDFDRYNMIREKIFQTRYDLQRLRDPLQLQLPIQHIEKKQVKCDEPPTD